MTDTQKPQASISRKLLYIIVPLFIALTIWFGFMLKAKYFPPKAIHYHAGFIVIKNNKIEDFSGIQYMHAKPCGNAPANEKETEAEQQIEKAHLHDFVGDVVHVHREGAAWKDLFTNLAYKIDYADVEGYINGKKIPDFQNQPIKPYDSLVIFNGKNENITRYLKQAVTKSHIEQVEKKSDNCGS